jgi:nucleoside-diphosphate-sugar epimerase
MRIFLAGATGAIGRRLTPLLLAASHDVIGTTRSADKARELEARGVEPAIVDAFDRGALMEATVRARPDIVIHQLTDLPQVFDPARRTEILTRNARLRAECTANLMAAAHASGCRRVIAQSLAFVYGAGPEPHLETDALASAEGEGRDAINARGVRALEEAVLNAPGIEGVVLRYGLLYGPGTWFTGPTGPVPLHVDAAARAAFLALSRGSQGIYNIAEDNGAVSIEKARKWLGFDPAFRLEAALN